MPNSRVKIMFENGALLAEVWDKDGVAHSISSILSQSQTTVMQDGVSQSFDLAPSGLQNGRIAFKMPSTKVEVVFDDVPDEAVAQLLVANGL